MIGNSAGSKYPTRLYKVPQNIVAIVIVFGTSDMHMYTHICICLCICICIRIRICVCIYAPAYANALMCVYACMCIYIYMCVRTECKEPARDDVEALGSVFERPRRQGSGIPCEGPPRQPTLVRHGLIRLGLPNISCWTCPGPKSTALLGAVVCQRTLGPNLPSVDQPVDCGPLSTTPN